VGIKCSESRVARKLRKHGRVFRTSRRTRHGARALVGSYADELGMPEQPIARPFDERHVGNDPRLDPAQRRHVLGGDALVRPVLALRQLCGARGQHWVNVFEVHREANPEGEQLSVLGLYPRARGRSWTRPC
jgi:hypothetical protein